MDALFIGLAVAALALPIAIEGLKRPRVEIVSHDWHGQTNTPWHFATAYIRNRPLHPLLARVLVRQSATAATATIEFRKAGQKVLPEIAGRWSSRPEPIQMIPVAQGQTVIVQYDPAMVPDYAGDRSCPGPLGGSRCSDPSHGS